jgi:GNAT superfamily N-acetyltransferase
VNSHPVRIESPEPSEWARILRASLADSFDMVHRLLDDFAAGTNQFDLPGEGLWVHTDSESNSVIGVCGLNREAGAEFDHAGRVRRMYIIPDYREQGYARSLLETIMSFAPEYYELLTVNVGPLAAGSFYEHFGFDPIEHPRITHTKSLMDIGNLPEG